MARRGAAGAVLVALGLAALSGHAFVSQGSPGARAPPASVQLALTAAAPATVAPAALPGSAASGCFWASVAALAAVAAASTRSRRAAFVGSSSAAVATQTLPGDDADARILEVAMQGVKQCNPYVRVSDRTRPLWKRLSRINSAAKNRFLIREDGTVWRRQPGLRHLKSKKNKNYLSKMKRMIMVQKKDKRRVGILLGIKIPSRKASDYIMRKFNEQRLHDGDWTSDLGVGHSVFGSGI